MATNLYTDIFSKMKHNEDISEALYHFQIEDGYYVERVIKALDILLERNDLTSIQASSIKKIILGLERLPLPTPGLNVRIELSEKGEDGAVEYSICLDENEFMTDSGGFGNGPGGSDSYSGLAFQVGKKFRNCDAWTIFDLSWPDVFAEMSQNAKLSIIDDSDNALLDWDHPDGSIFWEWIEAHPEE